MAEFMGNNVVNESLGNQRVFPDRVEAASEKRETTNKLTAVERRSTWHAEIFVVPHLHIFSRPPRSVQLHPD